MGTVWGRQENGQKDQRNCRKSSERALTGQLMNSDRSATKPGGKAAGLEEDMHWKLGSFQGGKNTPGSLASAPLSHVPLMAKP